MGNVAVEELCLGCMSRMPEGADVCPLCGWKRGEGNLPSQLPAGTILGGRYYVGRVMAEGDAFIAYAAWDLMSANRVKIVEYFPRPGASRGGDGYSVIHQMAPGVALAFARSQRGVWNSFEENGTAYAVVPAEWTVSGPEKKDGSVTVEVPAQQDGKKRRGKSKNGARRVSFAALCKKLFFLLAGLAGLGGAGLGGWLLFDKLKEAFFQQAFFQGHEEYMSRYVTAPAPMILTAVGFLGEFLLLWLALSGLAWLRKKAPAEVGRWRVVISCAGAAVVTGCMMAATIAMQMDHTEMAAWLALGLGFMVLAFLTRMRGSMLLSLLLGAVVTAGVFLFGLTSAAKPVSLFIDEGAYTGPQTLLSRSVEAVDWEDMEYDIYTYRAYRYDLQGHLMEMREYEEDGRDYGSAVYAYDKDGRLAEERRYYSSGRLETAIGYEYDASGGYTATGRDRDGELQTVRTYNSDGDLVEELKYAYGSVERTSYEYTWSGGMKVRTDSSGAREEYRYDDAGRLIRIDRYDSDGVSDGHEEFTYNGAGDLIQQTDYTASVLRYTTTEDFIYEQP